MKLANFTLLTTALVLGLGIGQATPVLPGGTVFNDMFSASQDVTLVSSIVNAPWHLGSGPDASHGTYTDAVYLNTSGTLDFVYQFTNASTSKVGISETSAFNFDGFTTDVGFVTNGGSLPGGIFANGSTVVPGIPDSITRSMDGSTVTFNFNNTPADNLLPGVTSAVLMISTNATQHTSGGGGIIASGTFDILAFQPRGVIPEPSFLIPLAGLFLVLGGFVAMRRRRRVQV